MCTPCKQILTIYKGVNKNVAGYCNFIFQREIWLLISLFVLSFQNPTCPEGCPLLLLEPHKLIATPVALLVVLNLLLLPPSHPPAQALTAA